MIRWGALQDAAIMPVSRINKTFFILFKFFCSLASKRNVNIKRKCGAKSFICSEVLEYLCVNKQYPTPVLEVWGKESAAITICANTRWRVWLPSLRIKKFSRFQSKDKSDYTFIEICICRVVVESTQQRYEKKYKIIDFFVKKRISAAACGGAEPKNRRKKVIMIRKSRLRVCLFEI